MGFATSSECSSIEFQPYYEPVARKQLARIDPHLMQVLQVDEVLNLFGYALDCRALMISTTGASLLARPCDGCLRIGDTDKQV